jgi:hypothetical protein
LGGAGPDGTDAVDLRNWLLRFGEELELPGTLLAHLADWLANEHPPSAAYRVLMACQLVPLDKSPGVRPAGIGKVYRRLMAKCILKAIGHQATDAAGNLNLCAGLPARIKGAIHTVRQATAALPLSSLTARAARSARAPRAARGGSDGGAAHAAPGSASRAQRAFAR